MYIYQFFPVVHIKFLHNETVPGQFHMSGVRSKIIWAVSREKGPDDMTRDFK